MIQGMAEEGRPYKGVLYAGLMIRDGSPEGPGIQCPIRGPGNPTCVDADEGGYRSDPGSLHQGRAITMPDRMGCPGGGLRGHGFGRISRGLREGQTDRRSGGSLSDEGCLCLSCRDFGFETAELSRTAEGSWVSPDWARIFQGPLRGPTRP